ncbi:MAG: Pseudouridine-5'-phosphate glycosidase [Alphaproteobacteria bacterium MarineAlpha5_Bin12]|nr:MAG: Pseudouridine-5'-phosphate glycosidase [Alphaproteobacteria bacterium MarineAlpha5_Bin12]|tara:strand:+ start:16935 stop:17858 length:924 start_codon:yes stop_codon:yes gene_type:complete
MKNNKILISAEVKSAIKKKKPIVALESTLISHGLPYPLNISIANKCIDIIKKNNATPATIGIIDGNIKIGLNKFDIKKLAKLSNVEKVSRHNLSLSMFKNKYASTTVASTMMIASLIGIKIFSTGGIGGVHMDSESTYDISSDLKELEKQDMIVISSGAKSILDIFKTNEMLETLGITRIGFKTNYVPGFWTEKTNMLVDAKVNNIEELGKIVLNRKIINQKSSILIYNPVEKKYSVRENFIKKWMKIANKKAKLKKIKGKNLTPYLLKEISKLSNEKTLRANTSLIINNAKLAAKIAAKLNIMLWK